MMNTVRVALAAACAIGLAGCAGMITGGPLIRPGEPTGVIQVANGSGYNVNVVLISACNVSTYGLNRLPDGAGIAPGRSYDFQVSAGCWDVSAGSTSGMVEARQRMNIPAGGGVRYTVQ
ncbi:hypothetical protein U91I_03100 [alpha proteobacterium U9-1i]|nr:hypothetical protein U91I_03100 [alpha proteobacterium U9-1i]